MVNQAGTDEGDTKREGTDALKEAGDIITAPDWLPAIIESADDAIISKTLEGIITSWNQAAERIFGYTADEIIGKPVLTIIPPELRNEETLILSKIRSGERLEHYETVRLRKDGTKVDISLTVSPIKNSQGRVIGASKIARDITDHKRAEHERRLLLQAAEEARRDAEAANKAKDNFLALLSHELRTPLHSMRGWLTMLSNGVLTDEQRIRAYDVLTRGIESQKALIEDLLDVSRIVSGKLSISSDKVSLVSVVANSIEQIRPLAAEHGITITTEFDSRADDIIGDSTRLQQVVNNLVNNAIKYSPPGTEVEVHLRESEGRALLSIKDSGIGISRQHLSRIFERFEQGDSSTRRSFGGLGLGLTIARHLTELHGGTIEVESEGEGLGAVFTVSLPLNRNVVRQYFSKRKPGSDSEAESNLLRKTRILIVEDDVDSLEMLRLVLENSGAEVTPVDRSQKAVDELSRNSFDLIISDLGLPGMDGYDLIQEVRGGLGIDPKRLPAIALSGYVAEDDRHRSLSNGFQMHLQKPLDVSTLASTVKALLDELKRNN